MRRPLKFKTRNLGVRPSRTVLSAAPAGRRLARSRGAEDGAWMATTLRTTVSTRLRAGLVLRRVVRAAAPGKVNSNPGAGSR